MFHSLDDNASDELSGPSSQEIDMEESDDGLVDDDSASAEDANPRINRALYKQLYVAIAQRNPDGVREALEELQSESDINEYDNIHPTPLRKALDSYLTSTDSQSREYLLTIIGTLIERGASVTLLEEDLTSLNFILDHPKCDEPILRLLLDMGSDIADLEEFKEIIPDVTNKRLLKVLAKQFPGFVSELAGEIEFLISSSCWPILEILANTGHSILIEEHEAGSTLCYYYAKMGEEGGTVDVSASALATTRLLLSYGASVTRKNIVGDTAIGSFKKLILVARDDEMIEYADNSFTRQIKILLKRFQYIEEKQQAYLARKAEASENIAPVLAYLDEYFSNYPRIEAQRDINQITAARNELLKAAFVAFHQVKIVCNQDLHLYVLLKDIFDLYEDPKLEITCDRKGQAEEVDYSKPAEFSYLSYSEGFYRLPVGDLKQKIFGLVSSYLYEAKQGEYLRHASNVANIILQLIDKLDPGYEVITQVHEQYVEKALSKAKNKKKSHKVAPEQERSALFEAALKFYERYEDDFCDQYASDNSDDEEERRFQAMDDYQKDLLSMEGASKAELAGAHLLVKEEEGKEKLKYLGPKLHQRYTDKVRANTQKLYRELGEITPQVQSDFELINDLLEREALTEETIQQSRTRFVVAGFRGIHYARDHFSKTTRKADREEGKSKKPLYARAVREATKEAAGMLEPVTEANLTEHALFIKDQLWSLRQSGPMSHKFTGKVPYLFTTASLAHQNFYSASYAGFHHALEKATAGGEQIARSMADFSFMYYPNRYNPNISFGSTPRRPLDYAYGSTNYAGHHVLRLEPNWRMRDGKVAYPYVGKVITTFHTPLDLATAKPYHMPSLNSHAETRISHEICAERELTFSSLLQGDVIVQHKVKYPSFKETYDERYLYRFGLDRKLYFLFRENIISTHPHSEERQYVVDLLTAYLMSFFEGVLLAQAHIRAKLLGVELVFINEYGKLTLRPDPPVINPHKKDSFDNAKQSYLKNLRRQRKNVAQPQDAFLYRLSNQFNAIYFNYHDDSLLLSVAKVIKNIRFTLENLSQYEGELPGMDNITKQACIDQHERCFQHYQAHVLHKRDAIVDQFYKRSILRLYLFAQLFQCHFRVHDSNLNQALLIQATLLMPASATLTYDLHYLGGRSFAALIAKETSTPAVVALPKIPASLPKMPALLPAAPAKPAGASVSAVSLFASLSSALTPQASPAPSAPISAAASSAESARLDDKPARMPAEPTAQAAAPLSLPVTPVGTLFALPGATSVDPLKCKPIAIPVKRKPNTLDGYFGRKP